MWRAATLGSNAKVNNGDLNWIANYIWGIADDVSCETSTCVASTAT